MSVRVPFSLRRDHPLRRATEAIARKYGWTVSESGPLGFEVEVPDAERAWLLGLESAELAIGRKRSQRPLLSKSGGSRLEA